MLTRVLTMAALLGLSTTALAVPLAIDHQGRLADSTGAPLDGTFDLTFSLYDDPAAGTVFWTETQSLLLDNGYFHARLGANVPLDSATFDGDDVYLGVAVGTGAELPDRLHLTTIPYAFRAATADSVFGGVVDASELRIDGTTVIDSTGALSNTTMSFTDLTNVPADSDTLAGLACTADQLAVFDGTIWGCVARNDHAHAAGEITSGVLDSTRLPVGTGGDQVASGDHGHTAADVGALAAEDAGTPVLGSDSHLDRVRTRLEAGEVGNLSLRYWQNGVLDSFGAPASVDSGTTTAEWLPGLWKNTGVGEKKAPSTSTSSYNTANGGTFAYAAGSETGTTTITKTNFSYEHATFYKPSLGGGFVRWGFVDDGHSNTSDNWRQWGIVDDRAPDIHSSNTIHARNDFPGGTAFYATWKGAGDAVTMYFFRGGANYNNHNIGTQNRDTTGSSGGTAVVDISAGDEIWIERDPLDGNAVRFFVEGRMVHEFSDTPSFDLYGYAGHGYPNSSPKPVFIDAYYMDTAPVPQETDLVSESHTAAASPATATLVLLEEDLDAINLNTDLLAWVSRDDGTNWTEVALLDAGPFDAERRLLFGTAELTGPDGTDMRYKLSSANAKGFRLHGASLEWAE